MMTGRRYIKSSSFIMAMLFTILCGAAALSLGYFINYFARGHFEQSTGNGSTTTIYSTNPIIIHYTIVRSFKNGRSGTDAPIE